MFVIISTYLKPIAEVEQYLSQHRDFLEQGYQKNYFVASGPQNPRTGGIIISQLSNKKDLERILNDDPFQVHRIAKYDILEFEPVKYHKDFTSFIKSEVL
jgi:uncharacterized protein YciI